MKANQGISAGFFHISACMQLLYYYSCLTGIHLYSMSDITARAAEFRKSQLSAYPVASLYWHKAVRAVAESARITRFYLSYAEF